MDELATFAAQGRPAWMQGCDSTRDGLDRVEGEAGMASGAGSVQMLAVSRGSRSGDTRGCRRARAAEWELLAQGARCEDQARWAEHHLRDQAACASSLGSHALRR